MACAYPITYATTDLNSTSFGVSPRSSSSSRRSSRSSSTSSRRSSSTSSRVSTRDSSPNPLDSQIRKSRATCTLSLTHVYVPGPSSASSGATMTAMMVEGAALSDTRLPHADDADLHVDVKIEQIRAGGMENCVGVGAGDSRVEEVTTEEEAVPEFAAALKLSTPSGKSRSVASSSPPRTGSAATVSQIPFPTSTSSTSISTVNTTTATRMTTPSVASAAGSSPTAQILLRTSTLPPSTAMSMQRPTMFIHVAPLNIRTGARANKKPSESAPPVRRSRKSGVSLPGVPIATKGRVSSRLGKAIPIPVPIPEARPKVVSVLGDHIVDEDSLKLREREAERLAVTTVTATHARGESSSPPPYSPEPPSYEVAAVQVPEDIAPVQEEDKPTLHQPQPIRAKSYVDLTLLKPSLVAQLSKSQSKAKATSSSPAPKSNSISPPPRRRVTPSDVRILLHLYRTITLGLEKRHRAYEAAKAAERLEEAARIAKKKLEAQWRFPVVEEDVEGEESQSAIDFDRKEVECVLDEDEEERILVPATPPPTRNSSRSSTPILVAPSPSPYHGDSDIPRHTAKFQPEMEVQDAILSIRLRNFLKNHGMSERELEVRYDDDTAVEEVDEEEEDDGGSVTYDLLQEEDEEGNGASTPVETPAAPAAPLPTTPPPPSPPPKPSSPSQFIMSQSSMIALLTMRARYANQRGRRSSKDDTRDSQGKRKMKSSRLSSVVAVGRGFEGVVVECVDEDTEVAEEEEEEVVVSRG